jgi:hypothetical protein
LFVHLGELSAKSDLPVRAKLPPKLSECAVDAMRRFEEYDGELGTCDPLDHAAAISATSGEKAFEDEPTNREASHAERS